MIKLYDCVWGGTYRRATTLAAVGLLFGLPFLVAQNDEEEEEIFQLSPFTVNSVGGGYRPPSKLEATVGGAQDIRLTATPSNGIDITGL